jgi:hypothetical protein
MRYTLSVYAFGFDEEPTRIDADIQFSEMMELVEQAEFHAMEFRLIGYALPHDDL